MMYFSPSESFSKRGKWHLWSYQPPKGWKKTYDENGIACHQGTNADSHPYKWYRSEYRRTMEGAIKLYLKLMRDNGHCNVTMDGHEQGYFEADDAGMFFSRKMWRDPEAVQKHYKKLAKDHGLDISVIMEENIKL